MKITQQADPDRPGPGSAKVPGAYQRVAGLPDPEEQPVMSIPEAGRRAFGLSRTASYKAAANGQLPTVPVGSRRKVVPTGLLRRMLGMDGGDRHVTAA